MPAFFLDDNQVERISGMTREYPYCMHVTDITEFTVPWHWHEELELNYVKQGAMKVITTNTEYVIHEGEAFFINTNVMEMKEAINDTDVHAIEIAHLFHPVFLTGHFQSLFESKYLNPILKNRQIEVVVMTPQTKSGKKMIQLLKDAEELQKNKDMEFQTRNILSEAWLVLIEELNENAQNLPSITLASQERIRYMISYIHRNYAEKISLKQIAASASIGEREALRCFQKTLNRTPFDYLNEYRLNQAKKLLSETDLSVTQIALQTGFSDSAYFGKVFRKLYHMTPKEFQADYRK
ncbi:MAG: AraC family transcriptional regulator [Eubacteriales bacterium]|nr:AraC family transcriptional regulator [Eubacteriales bacterium]